MADDGPIATDAARSPRDPAQPPVSFVRHVGSSLPRTAAEGWVKKIDRPRRGKVWVGFFHLWTTAADGRRVRKLKEKTLGPALMPKHEAQKKLADYIEQYTGLLTKRDLPTRYALRLGGCGSSRTSKDTLRALWRVRLVWTAIRS
jgi:hypothetical protein